MDKKDIQAEIRRLETELPEAKRGMPAHVIREKIRLLKRVLEE